MPPTGQNLPIAVIIHGSHDIGCPSPDGYTSQWPCPGQEIPNYQGFAYLLEALAARGYVAISINANPAFVSAYGMPTANDRLSLLLDQYLEKIAAANNGKDVGVGVDLTDRINWKQLVVLGHSAGGEAVNWLINSRRQSHYAGTDQGGTRASRCRNSAGADNHGIGRKRDIAAIGRDLAGLRSGCIRSERATVLRTITLASPT